jgi:glucokinase
MRAVAGVDVGATTVRAAIADSSGDLLATATEATPETGETIAGTIRTVLRTAADGAGIPLDGLAAVGVGAMGPLDREAGAVVDPPNVPGADRVPVVETVESVHDGDVVLRNDAVAAAVGERYYSDEPLANFVYLTISSGVGAGAIVDGHLLQGATGNAAEMGHVTIAPESDQQCGCGGTGHWEALCSGRHVPETARRLASEEGISTELDLEGVTPPDLFDAVGSDPLADRLVERLAEYNAVGVAALVHAYDPDRIHVGGGVATANPEAVVDPLRRRLPEHVVGETPTVEVTPLGTEAVLRGAVATALNEAVADS